MLLRRLCRSAVLAPLSPAGLALYLHLVLEAHPRSLIGTLSWVSLSRRLARSRRALEKDTRGLEQLGFVALDPGARESLLRYRILPSNRWRPRR